MPWEIPDTPEELLRQGRRQVQALNLQKWLPTFVVFIVILGIAISSFYTVGPDELGVIRRFGKYVRTEQPGLHWKLPFNMERLDLVKVTRIFKEEFGFRTNQSGVKTEYSQKNFLDESLMLTGDLNVIEVTWIIQFRIKEPEKVLFKIADIQETLRDLSEAVMREVIGDSFVGEVLTTRRINVNQEAKDRLQKILDSYDSGVYIEDVKLQDVNPPDEVKSSFNEVNAAKQEKERVINEAWEAYNKAIPKAKGEALKTLSEAEGYALQRVNEAKGNANKFLATWEAYKESKDVTRRRLYLETLDAVLPQAGKVYVTGSQSPGIVPLLNLQERVK